MPTFFSILIHGVESDVAILIPHRTECANFPFPFFMQEVFSQRCDDGRSGLPADGEAVECREPALGEPTL